MLVFLVSILPSCLLYFAVSVFDSTVARIFLFFVPTVLAIDDVLLSTLLDRPPLTLIICRKVWGPVVQHPLQTSRLLNSELGGDTQRTAPDRDEPSLTDVIVTIATDVSEIKTLARQQHADTSEERTIKKISKTKFHSPDEEGFNDR